MLTLSYVNASGRTMRVVSVSDFAAASDAWCAYRDERGLRSSTAPHVLISDDAGAHVGHVSYNGRVWAGLPTDPVAVANARRPLYDPFTATVRT